MEQQENQRLGSYLTHDIGGEIVRAYVPAPLPPVPAVRLGDLQILFEQANQSLGRLDGLASVLPDLGLFIYAYVRKEAVLSSQIEGTQSSLSDLLLFENDGAPGVPIPDVQEVSNYVAALNHGLARVRGGFPLSLRLIREIHEVLLSKGRGSTKEPGEFRRSQNWIGGTRPGNAAFVPHPPERVMECMGELEKFLHVLYVYNTLGAPMNRKLTITVSEEVYEGLHRRIGRRRISQFIERLARPHVVPEDIEAAYREMAADQAREQEALEWSEGLIADSTPAEPHASR